MSGPSGTSAPPPTGVVCNSALSFVAAAQPLQPGSTENEDTHGNLQETSGEQNTEADRMVPVGLKALCEACAKLYPDQPNPLQVTTRLKYWLGGEDPLDYISMYWHPGIPDERVPPHWHYISFGLSDLHGDGRVHPPPGQGSGYGFELTFRLKAPPGPPPLWPAALCQALARYVFTTGNKFCAGDHISWHRALDGSPHRTRVRHLLVAKDPALPSTSTPHGSVEFLQIVGCTGRELRAAQRGSGFDVLQLMREDANCGGSYLVSCPRRVTSALGTRVSPYSARSTLAGVSCRLTWAPELKKSVDQPSSPSDLTAGMEQQIKETLQRGLSAMSTDSTGKGQAVGHMSTDSFEMSSMERALPQITDTVSSWNEENSVQYLEAVHIFMDPEGASLLPLAIDGRIKQGAHFTWRDGDSAVTFLSPSVLGGFASTERPIAARADWLQVVIPPSQAAELSTLTSSFSALSHSDSESDTEPETPPPVRSVTSRNLTVTVLSTPS